MDYQLGIENKRISNIVHANRLKPFTDRTQPPNEIPNHEKPFDKIADKFLPPKNFPPLVKPAIETTDIKQDNIYQAEKILKERTKRGKKEYKIKWFSYPTSEATWECEDNIIDKSLIKNFRNKNNQIRRIIIPEYNQTTRNLSWGRLATLLFVILIFCKWTPTNGRIIASVVDCSHTNHIGIQKINDIDQCSRAINSNLGNIQTFKGTVEEYSKVTSKVNLIYCTAKKSSSRGCS